MSKGFFDFGCVFGQVCLLVVGVGVSVLDEAKVGFGVDCCDDGLVVRGKSGDCIPCGLRMNVGMWLKNEMVVMYGEEIS